ncbi:MAG: C-terminal binding protein [Candidatus Accumulibacter sp.]|jgi:D-3-phosphoglycerate dehydrogenase|nr:C-terminal binding protein [Accumulibacter sp.]
MKLVILDGYSFPGDTFPEPIKVAKENGFEFVVGNAHTEEEVIELAHDADGMLVVYVRIDEPLLRKLPKIKVIVRTGVGFDNFDLAGATRAGVIACNTPDYGVGEVATSATAMLLALERKLLPFSNQLRKGNWDDGHGYTMYRLTNRVVGFVGFGRIARQTAKFLAGFGYRFIAYDPYLPASVFAEYNTQSASLDEVLSASDALILMAPLTSETHHVIRGENIAKMKKGVLIVNTARGPLVKIDDLIEALKSGHVRGAALDVFENEPIKDASYPLWAMENVIATPHAAYRSEESFVALKTMATETLTNLITGKREPYNVINPDVLKVPNRLSEFLKKT